MKVVLSRLGQCRQVAPLEPFFIEKQTDPRRSWDSKFPTEEPSFARRDGWSGLGSVVGEMRMGTVQFVPVRPIRAGRRLQILTPGGAVL